MSFSIITAGFFGKAVLEPLGWQKEQDGSYVSRFPVRAPYFGPLSPKELADLAPEINPLDLYHSHRPEINTCTISVELRLTPRQRGFDLAWTTAAPWPVFTQLSLMFGTEGGFFDELGLRHLAAGDYLLEDNWACYRNGPWSIEVSLLSPAQARHRYATIRGDVGRSGTLNLLINGVSGCETRIEIRGHIAGVR